MSVPNVNLFINYSQGLKDMDKKHKDFKLNYEKRKFYSCNQEFDFLKYVSTGSKEKIDFVDYSGNEEKSKGIFNKNGIIEKEFIKELRSKLRTTNSPIWHGLMSFTEDFGDKYCSNIETAIMLMKSELHKFFHKAGFEPKNIIWFAGLHENTDNKHIHFSFFEKEPLRKKINSNKYHYSQGRIALKAINSFKLSAEIKLINHSSSIVDGRKLITDDFKSKIQKAEFIKTLNQLNNTLPKSGRFSYDSDNLFKYKPYIDNVINKIIISNKTTLEQYNNFFELIKKQDLEYKRVYDNVKIKYDENSLKIKYKKDINRRLGNIVLNYIKNLRHFEKRTSYQTKNRLMQKRIEKMRKKFIFNRCIKLNDAINAEIINAFQEYMQTLENARYARLREENME